MEIWYEKYRPSNLSEVVLDENIRETIKGYLNKGTISNLLLFGSAGRGKTSLSKVIVNELKATELYINASCENGVDIVRNKITDFGRSVGFGNQIKIVVLDEADGLTDAGQNALRNVIDECSTDTRFIFTCNYLNKIIPPIASRCVPIEISFSTKDVLKRCLQILKSENIEYKDSVVDIAEIVSKSYPDIRKTIGILEQCCINNKFEKKNIVINMQIDEVIEVIKKNLSNPKKCREYWIKNSSMFGNDYMELGSRFFNSILENLSPKGILYVGDRWYQLNQVLDKEIGFYLLVCEAANGNNK